MTVKTNPVYASIAYRKAIVTATIALVRRQFCIDDSGKARAALVCEEVFHVDAQVPEEEFLNFLNELEDERAKLDLQLRRFTLVEQKNESKGQEGNGGKGSRHRKGRGKTSGAQGANGS